MSSTSGMSDYLQGNNPPLTVDNYNEMDALTLASLSYIEFEKVYPDYQNRTVTVQEFAKDALASGVSLSDSQRSMLEQLQNADRFSQCTISHMAAENQESQWAAITVSINDGSQTDVLAMRGTNGTQLGWDEDFELAYQVEGTRAQQLSADYLQNSDSRHIFLAGHSKGGNDVVSAYVMSEKSVRDRVIHIDNFDGPGVNDAFRDRYAEGYGELKDKLENYYPQDSLIGLLLNENPGTSHFIHCTQSEQYKSMGFLGEHDPYTWQLGEDGKTLQSDDQSYLSKVLNTMLDDTLGEMTQQERYNIVQALIKMQATTAIAGKETLYHQNLEVAEAYLQEAYAKGNLADWNKGAYGFILKAAAVTAAGFSLYSQLTDQEQEVLRGTLGALLYHGLLGTVKVKVGEVLDWMAEQYRFVAGIISRKRQELADLILHFADTIYEKIGSWYDRVADFFTNREKSYSHGHDGPTAFEADTRVLQALADDLVAQQRVLQNCEQEVRQIARSLVWQMSVGAAWQVGRLAGNIGTEAGACGRLSAGLRQAGRQYAVTENRIAMAAGL